MWIHDIDGDLINTDHIVLIEAKPGIGSRWKLVAHAVTDVEVSLVEV